MVKFFFNLRTTNNAGIKQAHVGVANDDTPGDVMIEFMIDGNLYTQALSLSANQRIVISVTHTETGPREPVSARERMSGKITQKLLDLDAVESF